MKTKLRLTFVVLISGLLLASAQAQYKPQAPVYGADVQVFSYFDCMHATSKVSVADNGWIYVIAIVEAPGSSYQAWRVWRSIDEGITFEFVCNWAYNTTDYILTDVDMVVTGNDPTNINLWVGELCNSGTVTPHNAYARVTQWDANGNYIGAPYYLDYMAAPNETKYISMATDYRSPGVGGSPFTIAVAFTGQWGGNDWLTYAYSLDGGVTFHGTDIYSEAGTGKLGRISMALGGTINYGFGRYVIAFEMNKSGDLGDIGVLCNYTDNTVGNWLIPVAVNTLFPPAAQKCRFPTVSVMDNMTAIPSVSTFFPFVVTYEEWSAGSGAIDLMFASLKPTISPTAVQPALADFVFYWMGAGTGFNETEPNLAFDKTYNNFLLTYVTNDNNQLKYKVSNIEDFQSALWADYGNYRDAGTPFTWQAAPKTDINLSKAQVCFSWVEQAPDFTQSVYFDAEWSTVGVNENPGNKQAEFRLYPNPAKDNVNLEILKNGEYTMVITDNLGRDIINKTVKSGNQLISLDNLSKGIYMVRIFGKDFDSSKKLIIE